MNRIFWALRLLALAILMIGIIASSSPGIEGNLLFWALIVIGTAGLVFWPLICFYTLSTLSARHPLAKAQGLTPLTVATAVISFFTFFLGYVFPPIALLSPLWPIAAFLVLIHWLLTSPRFQLPVSERKSKVFMEAGIFILICLLTITIGVTHYPAKLRFRLSARAFNAAVSTERTMPATSPAHPELTPISIGAFTVYDIRHDSHMGTYFLTRHSGFFLSDDYHGFVFKPNPKASPFYSDKPGHTYKLTPTGVPDWYIFYEHNYD